MPRITVSCSDGPAELAGLVRAFYWAKASGISTSNDGIKVQFWPSQTPDDIATISHNIRQDTLKLLGAYWDVDVINSASTIALLDKLLVTLGIPATTVITSSISEGSLILMKTEIADEVDSLASILDGVDVLAYLLSEEQFNGS